MLILIFLGALFGPILGVFDPVAVKSFAPYIAALALAYILFDGGMGLNIKRVLHSSAMAVLLAVLGFVFSIQAFALHGYCIQYPYIRLAFRKYLRRKQLHRRYLVSVKNKNQ